GPCKMIAPIIVKLAGDYSGRVSFGMMDCDTNPDLVKRFRIMAIPTLLFFKDGEVVDQIVGVVPREEIEEMM
ncbi:MAG: thioredoxin family protein, partial [Methanomassiliicoccales archaeon]|nr:thioredoxin family protein [Methanomassiliicoccales archaeon]